ncbi:hypothetical protein CLV43_11444 [Umezawaea tangerina]|uniref:site-specific DNA-methyltransferase (adenine-specific) n=1 Tax=Umezawaea tangerina TaxID=84725 RepID=A0A2T0SP10_9PSEU|nr:hypothetical protein CLV43_11444 [Umezawaea tangerina]
MLLVVGYERAGGWEATVCGPGDDPAAIAGLDLRQVDRICTAALAEANPSAARRTLQRLLDGLKDQLIAGLTNQGLFASHELRHGVPIRPDWQDARTAGEALLDKTGLDLISGLGYQVSPHGSVAQVLTADGSRQAVAVLLHEEELFDRPGQRFGTVSPVMRGLAIAQDQGLHWLIVVRGTQLRLYPANPDVGVGRKGRSETFVELDLALLTEEEAGYLPLLFAPSALADNGTVVEILAASVDHASALGTRLRERVYVDVVPALAVAVARAMKADTGSELDEAELHEAYHRTLVILFRLLFVAYAEDRGLLPYQRNPRYTKKALKSFAREFTNNPVLEFDAESHDRWDDLLAVWHAVDDGNRDWGVPAYNGGLFADDPELHPSGDAIGRMRLTDAEIGPVLKALVIDVSSDGEPGPVDFRSLSVREFGTIYEGLLESSLSVAPGDLTIDPKSKAYLPAKSGDRVVVPAGAVYFHNASGARKATGSYFTKAFAVEHLLDTALEPALVDHLATVGRLLTAEDEAGAADKFFDFRVVDLAMGSGHFLVAAIDRMENRFATFLSDHPVPAVNDELLRLSQAAEKALGDAGGQVEIDISMLLRRQIARRCVYGLDLNPIAVELARLAIWIHTFVPGLPMSSLDHGLRVGNSLTGMGTVDEALAVFEPKAVVGQYSLFGEQIVDALGAARDRLVRVARTAEATKAEAREASRAHAEAMREAADAKTLLDAAVGVRLGRIPVPTDVDEALASGAAEVTVQAVQRLGAVHLPFLFPEVFMREASGFDVVLGNPPWEKVRWEPAPYWVGVSPGLIALPAKVREAKIGELRASHPLEAAHERAEQEHRAELQEYFKRGFTLRGGTHLELAQLMLERALKVLRRGGRIGLVLPRQSMVLAGWKNLRKALVEEHDLRLVQARNNAEWIFEDVHASYAVVFLATGPLTNGPVRVWVATSPDGIRSAADGNAIELSKENIESYSETDVIPWFVDSSDRDVFDRIRVRPRLSDSEGWITGHHDARWDFRGTGPDRALAVHAQPPGAWKVLMTAHVDAYAFDASAKFKQSISDLAKLVAKGRGAAVGEGGFVLDDTHPVVVVRHPSRSDDTRTLIATALPERDVLHNKGYVHAVAHQPGTSAESKLALLGLLNTNTLDWWVRRFVDRHVTAPVINQLPLPDWSGGHISAVADRVAVLLSRNHYSRLAGGIDLDDRLRGVSEDLTGAQDDDLLAVIEVLALEGYGLTAEDFLTIRKDFTDKGLSPRHLDLVLAHHKTRRTKAA